MVWTLTKSIIFFKYKKHHFYVFTNAKIEFILYKLISVNNLFLALALAITFDIHSCTRINAKRQCKIKSFCILNEWNEIKKYTQCESQIDAEENKDKSEHENNSQMWVNREQSNATAENESGKERMKKVNLKNIKQNKMKFKKKAKKMDGRKRPKAKVNRQRTASLWMFVHEKQM